MKAEKVNILEINYEKITMNNAVKKVLGFLKEEKLRTVYTPNPEIVMAAQEDVALKEILNNADLIVPDGIGIVIASKILKNPLPERVAGYDLVQNIFKNICKKDVNVYFLGAAPNVAEKAAKKMREKYKGLRIVGIRDGYFKDEEENKIIKEINDLKVDILLVGLGAPKQEKWIDKNKNKLNVKICMGVGGCFDGMSGVVKRAPLLFQKLGLEWFYRLVTQPKRAKRMLKLPLFLIEIYKRKQ